MDALRVQSSFSVDLKIGRRDFFYDMSDQLEIGSHKLEVTILALFT